MLMKSDKKISLGRKFDRLWNEAKVDSVPKKTSEKIYNGISRELNFNGSQKIMKRGLTTLLKYAAVLMIGISLIGYYFFSQKNTRDSSVAENKLIEFKTMSERQSVRLEDNSVINLLSNSSISYPEKFNDSIREVFLNGSAMFEIAESKEKPFIVHQGRLITQVLGTTFAIINDSLSNIIKVYLHTGKITVYNESRSFEKVLFPGDSLFYNRLDDREVIEKLEMDNKVYIKDASTAINDKMSITFVNVKIKDAYQEIQNKTGIHIDYSDIGIGGDIFITLDYKDKTIDKILKDLNSFSGYSYTKKDNSVVIKR